MSKVTKAQIIDWDEFIDNQNRQAPVDYKESAEDKANRIKFLEANPEEWFKYYFPKWCTAEPADFHKKSTRRVLNNPEWIEARVWSRELAKSARTMMDTLYLTLTGKKKNVVLVSNSYDNAVRLLSPFKSSLEKNERIINDYGIQEKSSGWTDGEFITRKGVAFRAIGAGQSPRGTRNENIRPDILIVDDFDTDEDCRNPDTVDKKFDWLQRAFYATRSISNPLLMVFCGNIIAEHCCMKLAKDMADHYEIVNIRDSQGQSSWPQKNTEAMIDRVLDKISYAAGQGEYFNNPITQGKVFSAINYGRIKPIKDYRFLVSYTDPSYKSGKNNDFKATALVGKWRDEYHVIRMYCAQTSTAIMIDWQYDIMKKYGTQVPIYFIIEWPSIDDALKMEMDKANKRHGVTLPLRADERVKKDKFYRIESLLEPLNRSEKLIFNKDMKDSEHMKLTEAQFKALSPTSRAHDDAPDAVEGAVFDLNSRISADLSQVHIVPRSHFNNKAY